MEKVSIDKDYQKQKLLEFLLENENNDRKHSNKQQQQ